ncbi:MAG: hypothetical protein GOMPHAMPRED_001763 [Gomphillus americanus]|uniref:Uncharacterized protein n=1 Tax=Gomphillus americanus TaxID=1940652 RepID=A0A8H3F744_9LECA|nr:MAG: hypothetical protein GOMPHAMPRED_001763 [Gomphillus americanus]
MPHGFQAPPPSSTINLQFDQSNSMAYKPPKVELLEAIDITASYYASPVPGGEGTLRLSGKFKFRNPVDYPRFERKRIAGGLLYEVRGLVYNPAFKEYTKPIPDHDTAISLPNRVFPSNSVTVKTSTGDVSVEIQFANGYASPLPESDASTVFEDLQADGVQSGQPLDTDKKDPMQSVRLHASDLTATYYKSDGTLQLTGNWWSIPSVIDAEFHPMKDFVGGIGYEVRGVLVAPTSESEVKQHHGVVATLNIKIELPNPVLPANTVVFFTKNGEKIVDIKFVDGPVPPTL